MIYQDRIYGEFKIEEPVILELIESRPVQRLKGIAQYGIPDEFYHLSGFSRFEHSIGVMLLLKKFNAGLEEQVAGLLHDISHTAFSHVFDWISGGSDTEDHQDRTHKDFISRSAIVGILGKYNLDIFKISQIEDYKLLEQKVPNLCADRIDYTFRDALWGDPATIQDCLNNLVNFNGNIVFTDLKAAELFARNYLRCQTEHWGGREAVGRYYYFSQIMKEALAKNILSPEDFYQDDKFVMGKIYASHDSNLINSLGGLKNKRLGILNNSGKKTIIKKFRYTDPIVLQEGQTTILSNVSLEFKDFLESQRLINSQGFEF